MGRNESHSACSIQQLFYSMSDLRFSLSFSLSFSPSYHVFIIIEKIFIFPLYLALASVAGDGGKESGDLIAGTIIALCLRYHVRKGGRAGRGIDLKNNRIVVFEK